MLYRIEMEKLDKNLFLLDGFDTDYEFDSVSSAMEYARECVSDLINKDTLFVRFHNERDTKILMGREQNMPVAKMDFYNGDIVIFTIWKKRGTLKK